MRFNCDHLVQLNILTTTMGSRAFCWEDSLRFPSRVTPSSAVPGVSLGILQRPLCQGIPADPNRSSYTLVVRARLLGITECLLSFLDSSECCLSEDCPCWTGMPFLNCPHARLEEAGSGSR